MCQASDHRDSSLYMKRGHALSWIVIENLMCREARRSRKRNLQKFQDENLYSSLCGLFLPVYSDPLYTRLSTIETAVYILHVIFRNLTNRFSLQKAWRQHRNTHSPPWMKKIQSRTHTNFPYHQKIFPLGYNKDDFRSKRPSETSMLIVHFNFL